MEIETIHEASPDIVEIWGDQMSRKGRSFEKRRGRPIGILEVGITDGETPWQELARMIGGRSFARYLNFSGLYQAAFGIDPKVRFPNEWIETSSGIFLPQPEFEKMIKDSKFPFELQGSGLFRRLTVGLDEFVQPASGDSYTIEPVSMPVDPEKLLEVDLLGRTIKYLAH